MSVAVGVGVLVLSVPVAIFPIDARIPQSVSVPTTSAQPRNSRDVFWRGGGGGGNADGAVRSLYHGCCCIAVYPFTFATITVGTTFTMDIM